MACRIEMIALHAHGEEADLDAFFEDMERAIEAKAEDAKHLWPSIEFMPPVQDAFQPWDPDGEDEYVEPGV